MKIISIDPGYERLGIAILEKVGKNKPFDKAQDKEVLVFSECFKTSSKLPHHERLALIGNRIKEVIKKYKPEQLATEKLFFSGNQKTAMLVAEARGVILYTGSSSGLHIFEYTPNEVKQAVSTHGTASKKEVQKMIVMLLGLVEVPGPDDVADALAVALCGAARAWHEH